MFFKHFTSKIQLPGFYISGTLVEIGLTFSPAIPTRHHRGRNFIWLNSPFNSNVKRNVGKLFLTLLFKKNNVSISYSCMPNKKSVIQNHNANLLSKHNTPVTTRSCSCRQKSECSLNIKCLSKSLCLKTSSFINTFTNKHMLLWKLWKNFQRTVKQSYWYI